MVLQNREAKPLLLCDRSSSVTPRCCNQPVTSPLDRKNCAFPSLLYFYISVRLRCQQIATTIFLLSSKKKSSLCTLWRRMAEWICRSRTRIFSTKQKSVVSFTLYQSLPRRKRHGFAVNRRLGWPRFGSLEKRINTLLLMEIEPQLFGHLARSIVTITTKFSLFQSACRTKFPFYMYMCVSQLVYEYF
jgi:hypothetical protein